MEPAVPSPAAPPLPVAWLQGDVLAEYLRFLELAEEEAAPAPAPRVPVAWLQGEVRDEFLRFLEESAAGGAATVTRPDRQEEGEEDHASAPHGSGDDGIVVDDVDGDGDYESLVEDDYVEEDEGGFGFVDDVDDDHHHGDGDRDADACVMEYRSEDGGVVFTMNTDEGDDPVLELLLPHILDLPAFRARAAGSGVVQQRQQQPPLAFPRHGGGWMMSSDNDDEMTDGEFTRRPDDGWMSSELQLLLSRTRNLLASSRARVAAAGVLQQQPPLAAFPCQDGGLMSSGDDEMMADEFPRQDDGWMSSDEADEVTDEFTGNRNRLQLRHTY